MRLTEQGEVISQRYSHPELALRSLEQTISAVVLATLAQHRDVPHRYRAEDERFAALLDLASPIDALTRLNIGSRPASRSGTWTVGELRAIPWVFAWMQ